MDSSIFSQIEQLTPCIIKSRVSYQFKHLQLKSKSSNSKNLVKKSSLGHLVSTDSSQAIPELKFQKYNIVLKKQNESFREGLYCVNKEKNKNFMSSVSLIRKKNNKIRPKSVSPGSNSRAIYRGMNLGKNLNVIIKKTDFELAPW